MCAHNVAVLPHSGHRFVSPTLAMAQTLSKSKAFKKIYDLARPLKEYHVSVVLSQEFTARGYFVASTNGSVRRSFFMTARSLS